MPHCALERGKEQSEEALRTADNKMKLLKEIEGKKDKIGMKVVKPGLKEINIDKTMKAAGAGHSMASKELEKGEHNPKRQCKSGIVKNVDVGK